MPTITYYAYRAHITSQVKHYHCNYTPCLYLHITPALMHYTSASFAKTLGTSTQKLGVSTK